MRIRFACARCESTVATGDILVPGEVVCTRCGAKARFAAPDEAGLIARCLRCAGPHLFLQKEFPRRVGLATAIVGAVAFLILMGFEWIYMGFAVLLGVALLDSVIYAIAPVMTVCYHCQTEFRRCAPNPHHGAYDPKIAFYTAKQACGLGGSGAPGDADAPEG